jgi:predicted dithiol-disulfide oxidoreductase (DUF899 family)
MSAPGIVTREQWLEARLELLEAEKDLMRRSDELAKQRRALFWVKITKPYVFEGPEGRNSLGDLFAAYQQRMG